MIHSPEVNELKASRTTRRRAFRARRRILRSISLLPALFTIFNGLAGFGSIHFATKDALGETSFVNLSIAAWLILVAMICDMLDGRLARMTRRTSDFGGQLDSLSDIISFGLAPAVLILRTTVMAMRLPDSLWHGLAVERAVWVVAAVYVACATLRLARFNVENEPGESAHMRFEGLPSPGAAATILALTLLLTNTDMDWRSSIWMSTAVSIALPLVTLSLALLMVSKFSYPHPVNQYIRGKRSFSYLVGLVVVILLAAYRLFISGAALAVIYSFSGPVVAIWRRRRKTAADKEASWLQ